MKIRLNKGCRQQIEADYHNMEHLDYEATLEAIDAGGRCVNVFAEGLHDAGMGPNYFEGSRNYGPDSMMVFVAGEYEVVEW